MNDDGTAKPTLTFRVRTQLNRLVSIPVLILLPVIAIAERLHEGWGLRVALRGISVLASLCGIKISEVRPSGFEIPDGAILVPNHSSLMDIPAMLVVFGRLRFIGASDLFKFPLLASAMRALNTVPLARKDPALAREQLDRLAKSGELASGPPLVIFPQGHITRTGEEMKFKLGAFSLAESSGAPLVPIAIHGGASVLPRRAYFAPRPGKVTVEILDPIRSDGSRAVDMRSLRDLAESRVRDAVSRGPK